MLQEVSPSYILFGGLFDPPHIGHTRCVELVQKEIPQAQILISPTPISPEARKSSITGAALQHREAMCQLHFSHLPHVVVNKFEQQLEPPYYTYKSLHYLKQMGYDSLGLLIGEDQFWNLPRWKHPEKILHEAQLIVIKRPPDLGINPISPTNGKELNPDIVFEYLQENIFLGNSERTHIPKSIVLTTQPHPASSTTLRRTLDQESDDSGIVKEWLSPQVLRYIRQNHLYESI